MSWRYGKGAHRASPESQRESSPPPMQPFCISQGPQISYERMFGADLTNRSPTPPPQRAPSGAVSQGSTEKKASLTYASPTTDASSSSLPPWSDYPQSPWRDRATADEEDIPSFEAFLSALHAGRQRLAQRVSGSCEVDSSSANNLCCDDDSKDHFPSQDTKKTSTLHQEEVQHPSKKIKMLSAARSKRKGTEDVSGDAFRIHVVPHRRPAKLPRKEGNIAAPDGHMNGLIVALTPHFPAQQNPPEDVRGTDQRSCASCVLRESTSLELDHLYRTNAVRVRPSTRSRSGFLTPLSTSLLGLHQYPPVSPTVSFQPQPLMCRPAGAFDVEASMPAWQVVATTPTELRPEIAMSLSSVQQGAHALRTAPQPSSDHPLRIASAVDPDHVYSTSSLEDIRPDLCLLEEWSMDEQDAEGITSGRDEIGHTGEDVMNKAHPFTQMPTASSPSLLSPFPSSSLFGIGMDKVDANGSVAGGMQRVSGRGGSFLHEDAVRWICESFGSSEGAVVR